MDAPAVRPAVPADAEAIAAIYNEGIADRVATFEREAYGGVGEHAVYVARRARGGGVGRRLLDELSPPVRTPPSAPGAGGGTTGRT